ncbi:zinc finger protein 320-like [Phlebotomus argentipes]|uniref:zinc finger protein 320-like n=1 Tax=Phlebotomus argentipes TaxID=94469 RepID=UPI0028929A1F|nr:zinc finger protein 320-like [Phlebotomus argentipes]
MRKSRQNPPKPVCIVDGCSTTSVTGDFSQSKKIFFHKFPNKPSKREEWKRALNVKSVTKKSLVCYKHFNAEDYKESSSRLTRNAVPHLGLSSSSSSSGSLNLEISVKEEIISNSDEVCRFCVGNTLDYSSIFQDDLHETLKSCFGLMIQKMDNWPKFICQQCLDSAKACIDFMSRVRESEKCLKDLYGEYRYTESRRKTEIKPEIEVVYVKPVSDIKVEKEDLNEEQPSKRESPDPQIPQEAIKHEAKETEEMTEEADDPDHDAQEDLLQPLNSTGNLEDKYKRIEDFYKLECNQCPEKFSKLKELQAHYPAVHKRKAYVFCCKVKLSRLSRMLQHIDFHMNPDIFKCQECGKNFKNKVGLQLHKVNSHTPQEKHIFKCSKCPRTFMNKHRLGNHSSTHLKDSEKKHICLECGKAFPARANLRIHIRYVHEEFSYHVCEICAKMFKNKESFVRHQKVHTGEKEETFPCPICGKIFTERQLKIHIKRHNESDQVFRCHICDRQSSSKSSLNRHIRIVHGEKKYKCNLCEKTFNRLIYLKEHVATHTSNQILYSCLFCPKLFNSNANKYVHQKRQHPEEYEAMKKKKALEGIVAIP